LRFTSHRDVSRALERALRRGDIPIAFSAGFSPHPKISYVGAAPTGTASEAEYLELGLAERTDPEEVRRRLDAALPDGLDVLEAVEAGPGSLADRIDASHWEIRLVGIDPEAAVAATTDFLAADSVPVERVIKDGTRTLDARVPVVSLRVRGHDCAILDLVVRHATPAVRPDDVLAALREIADLVTAPGDPAGAGAARGRRSARRSARSRSSGHPRRLGVAPESPSFQNFRRHRRRLPELLRGAPPNWRPGA
jgi:radical SAM-linked protein